MRMLLSTTLLLAMTLILGCSRSGDFGSFVVPQLTKYGGHPEITGITPKLEAHWTVQQDANGFTAHITHVSFSAVDGFMQQVYGAPNISIDTGLDGEQRRIWEAAEIGVGIELIGHKNGTELICVKGAR